MNPDTLKFEAETADTPPAWTRWQIGNICVLKKQAFRLDRVYEDGLRLRLVYSHATLPVFKKGEMVTINGVVFNVANGGRNSIVVRPAPKVIQQKAQVQREQLRQQLTQAV